MFTLEITAQTKEELLQGVKAFLGEETPKPAPAPPVAAAPSPPVAAPAVAPPVATAPTYSLDQIMQAGSQLITTNQAMLTPLNELLRKYGARTVSDLKTEQLSAFATEMRGLGASL